MAGNVYRYLNALVTEGSFSRAARVLQISQPSISQFLHRIEQEVGAKLIDRSAKPLRFTYAGECFMKTENEIEQLRQKRARLIATSATAFEDTSRSAHRTIVPRSSWLRCCRSFGASIPA